MLEILVSGVERCLCRRDFQKIAEKHTFIGREGQQFCLGNELRVRLVYSKTYRGIASKFRIR